MGKVSAVSEALSLQDEVDLLRVQIGADADGQAATLASWGFGNSLAMLALSETIGRVAPTDASVLVWGESGVGKEVVARRLHDLSTRCLRPFVKVNCAALPGELLESELFGYERGAFTGAHREKPGKFELADTGTILLDELGELPLGLQAKLLQVLQDGRFSRLGSRQDIKVDTRVIATTNRNLAELVERGGFRQDLYYRLNVISIYVPPLRERAEEIPILAERFVRQSSDQYGRPRRELSADTLRLFMEYSWPGNIRELENLVKRIVVLGQEDWIRQDLMSRHRTSEWDGFPSRRPVVEPPFRSASPAPSEARGLEARGLESRGLKEVARAAAQAAERAAIARILEQTRWNRMEAARRLKISYKALLYKIKLHGL
jgi:two-component system response regulator AtoC